MQELGLAYECLSTSETEAEYRAYQIANHPAIRHQHCSLEDQLQGRACALHPDGACVIQPGVDSLVVGAPCNPFSVMSGKRFRENAVMGHKYISLTFGGVLKLLTTFTPVTMTMETTDGFLQPLQKGSSETPYKLPLV